MVLFEITSTLQQDDSALVPDSKNMDMNADQTQHTEEGSDEHVDDANNDDEHDADEYAIGGDDMNSADDSDTDSAASGERAFGAFKSNANQNQNQNDDESGGAGSAAVANMRRCNSWTSFLTRSERHRQQADQPPSVQEMAERKVQFRDDANLEEVRVMELDPPLTAAEKDSCHLTDTDTDRMQLEVKMTFLRWDHHEDGQIEFNENQHSIRGLIDHVDEHCPQRNRDIDIHRHMNRVLEEQHSQRISGSVHLDPERVGQIARESAAGELERAQYIAQQDRIASEEAWLAPLHKISNFYEKTKATVVDKTKHRKDKKEKVKKDKNAKDKKKGMAKLAFWK
jgi:hypothetical protein